MYRVARFSIASIFGIFGILKIKATNLMEVICLKFGICISQNPVNVGPRHKMVPPDFRHFDDSTQIFRFLF